MPLAKSLSLLFPGLLHERQRRTKCSCLISSTTKPDCTALGRRQRIWPMDQCPSDIIWSPTGHLKATQLSGTVLVYRVLVMLRYHFFNFDTIFDTIFTKYRDNDIDIKHVSIKFTIFADLNFNGQVFFSVLLKCTCILTDWWKARGPLREITALEILTSRL